MNLADCYRVLGLRAGASFEDVKSSYRRLARQYHPDTNPDDQQAKEKFIEVTAAYKVLMESISPSDETDA
jgi:curved DNA-binding protein CbpA